MKSSDYWPDIHGGDVMCPICAAHHAGMIEYHAWINEVMQNEPDTLQAPGPEHEPPRWPTLLAIGLGDALDAVERVTAWAQRGKHPGPKWAGQTVAHQAAKLVGHLGRGLAGEEADEDTGEHPYAHVAARALMLVGLVLLATSRTGAGDLGTAPAHE